MRKINERRFIKFVKALLTEADDEIQQDDDLTNEPAPTRPKTPVAPVSKAPAAAPAAPAAPSQKTAPAAPQAPSQKTAPAAPQAPAKQSAATQAAPATKAAPAAPQREPAVPAAPASAAKTASPTVPTTQIPIPGMDNDTPADAMAVAPDAEQKIQQAKVNLFFQKLADNAPLMSYLRFTTPIEQAAAITKFAELVGVPKGQLVNVLTGIKQAANAQAQVQSESIRNFERYMLEAKKSRRDTSWAVKQIEEFIAKNEGQNVQGDDQYMPSMKLFSSAGDTKQFSITLDELRSIAKLLRRMSSLGKGGTTESAHKTHKLVTESGVDRSDPKNIDTGVSNIFLKGAGYDVNGNMRIIVGLPNDRGISIQTNGALPETDSIFRRNGGRYVKLNKLTDDEIQTIGREVTQYIKKYGSRNLRDRLSVYEMRKSSMAEAGTRKALRYIRQSDYDKYNLGEFPNFSATGSITGMKKQYYGNDALLVKCGNYIYNVSSNPEIYNSASPIPVKG